MSIAVDQIEAAFELMFRSFLDRSFAKSLHLQAKTERQLLPLIRVGLLCYFHKRVLPEVEVSTPWTKSKKSRIDFRIDKTAVEFAVRNPGKSKSNVSATTNQSEVKKLLKWREGRSVLVLFDFSHYPIQHDGFQEFRKHPSLGKGNHSKNAYTILYFHVVTRRPLEVRCHRKEIRRESARAA